MNTLIKSAFIPASLTGAMLLVAILAFHPRPPAACGQSVVAHCSVAFRDEGKRPTVTHDLVLAVIEAKSHPLALHAPTAPASAEQTLIDAIRAAIQTEGDSNWDYISQHEVVQLIKLNPQAAADFAISLAPGFIREQMLRQVAHGWADINSVAALTWAANLSDAADRTVSLSDVCMQISQTDPGYALATAKQYELTQQPGLLKNLMQQWATQNSTAALDWVERLPAGTERNEAVAQLAFVVAQNSPNDAATLVAYEIPAGETQDEAALSVLHQWALQDFAGASAWAAQFDSGSFRNRAERELAGINQKLHESEN